MKFGIVGIGKFGKNYIKNIREIEGSELVTCSSRTVESYNSLPPELSKDLIWTDNFNNLLKVKDIDTIIIATHPDSHFEYAKAALEAGKHVICEKPCMFSNEQFKTIDRLIAYNWKYFFTNYINLYGSKVLEMQRFIADNEFTKVELINVGSGPERAYSSLWDYGCHEVALAYVLNSTTNDGRVKCLWGDKDRYGISLRFSRSKVDIITGSGFPYRINYKVCSNEKGIIDWLDKKEEPLLKRMLEGFIQSPATNIDVSKYVSRVLSNV